MLSGLCYILQLELQVYFFQFCSALLTLPMITAESMLLKRQVLRITAALLSSFYAIFVPYSQRLTFMNQKLKLKVKNFKNYP